MTDWTEFAEGLAQQLMRLPAGAFLVITASQPPHDSRRFVQFAQTDDEIYGQLAGDEWIDESDRITADEHRLLTETGWQEPHPDHVDNWWVELPWPAPSTSYRKLASMAVVGLRDVFGIAAPALLTYRAWNGKAGNRDLDLPLLGLASTNSGDDA
ncbi:TY-Chap domain-containing protein [Nocardia sp. JW2]|uniref:TY-Chap domain-containing protein n=1 Tax=Nocardia sp. JW2 TaxID=3450738 RepID=UPI003F438724